MKGIMYLARNMEKVW